MKGGALDRRDIAGLQPQMAIERGDDDVDDPLGAVQPTPEIVVLTVRPTEKGAETVELDAFQGRLGAARANRRRVVGGNTIHLDRIELVQPFALEQGQGRDIEIGKTE